MCISRNTPLLASSGDALSSCELSPNADDVLLPNFTAGLEWGIRLYFMHIYTNTLPTNTVAVPPACSKEICSFLKLRS